MRGNERLNVSLPPVSFELLENTYKINIDLSSLRQLRLFFQELKTPAIIVSATSATLSMPSSAIVDLHQAPLARDIFNALTSSGPGTRSQRHELTIDRPIDRTTDRSISHRSLGTVRQNAHHSFSSVKAGRSVVGRPNESSAASSASRRDVAVDTLTHNTPMHIPQRGTVHRRQGNSHHHHHHHHRHNSFPSQHDAVAEHERA